ncbi:response regulator transcription factor [bacterium]|nr:MAG: response regulator transcription factor [bacterium]
MRVLIVEDDVSVAAFLKQALREASYSIESCEDGAQALQLCEANHFDAILLDVMLPTLDGFTVCRRLRARGVETPILLLTARDTLEDKIEGLDAGADDYIVKPFALAELMARLRALLRRGTSPATALQVDDLKLDPTTRKASRGGKSIVLSATEYSLLELLMRHSGKVVTRAALLDGVWQYDFAGNDNVLEVYISYLRRKIDKNAPRKLIHTVRGSGYKIGVEA